MSSALSFLDSPIGGVAEGPTLSGAAGVAAPNALTYGDIAGALMSDQGANTLLSKGIASMMPQQNMSPGLAGILGLSPQQPPHDVAPYKSAPSYNDPHMQRIGNWLHQQLGY